MVEKTIQMQNAMGLHARPAAHFVRLASKFSCNIDLIKDNMTVNGKSILGVMYLAAERGSSVTIRAKGDDDQEAVLQLTELLTRLFDEENNQKE